MVALRDPHWPNAEYCDVRELPDLSTRNRIQPGRKALRLCNRSEKDGKCCAENKISAKDVPKPKKP